MKKVAIIGAGAAGLSAAVVLGREGFSVDVFEQNAKPAKKIAVSGNGHCNITNRNISPANYTTHNPEFVEKVLKRFGYKELEKFLQSIGILLFAKSDGKCYPLSYEAKSVIKAYEETLKELGVNFFYDKRIDSIEKTENYTLLCKEEKFEGYDEVIVASGLKAAPQLGGNDDALRFASAFGHNIIEPYPALVGLHTDSSYNEMLSGVKIHGEATLYIDRLKEKNVQGDILFTAYGVSGLAVLDISQGASLALSYAQDVQISLNLLHGQNPQSLTSQLTNLCKALPEHTFATLLGSIVPHKLALCVLQQSSLENSLKASQVNPKIIKGVMNQLTNYRLHITDTHGYKHAEVCGGGVDTTEIDVKSFESKKLQGLYFVGELLDITGERGGYNFQFAFASGILCAQHIAKSH